MENHPPPHKWIDNEDILITDYVNKKIHYLEQDAQDGWDSQDSYDKISIVLHRLEQDNHDEQDSQDSYDKDSIVLYCLEQDGQDEQDSQDSYNKGSGRLHPEHHDHPNKLVLSRCVYPTGIVSKHPVQTMGGMK